MGRSSTVAAAWAAGLEFVDVYHFPVIRSQTAAAEVQQCLTFLSENNVKYGRLWLDVEGDTTGSTWWPNTATNVEFIQEFVTAMQAAGVSQAAMARRMKTSRAVVRRLLDDSDPSVTLATISRAALALGKQVRLKLAA